MIAAVFLLALAAPAHAAFPGQNGQIAFTTAQGLFVVNPDGSGQRQLPGGGAYPAWTSDGNYLGFVNTSVSWMDALGGSVHQVPVDFGNGDFNPTWSPDAQTVAVAQGGGSRIEVINVDGSNWRFIGPSCSCDYETPAWSPDGTKIAYSLRTFGGSSDTADIHVINADGTGDTQLTTGPADELNPDWSSDGQRITFDVERGVAGEPNGIYTMKADGSDVQAVPGTQNDTDPAWSPDGTKIVVRGGTSSIVTMNADGTDRTTVSAQGAAPDWGPAAAPRPPLYARPKGATPYQTYLVPAYKSCDAPNEQHGAPLSADSCSPPQQLSDFLTVGTLDANGQPAKFIG